MPDAAMEEEEEEVEQAPDAMMKAAKEEEEGEAEPALRIAQDGISMDNALGEFEASQVEEMAEQQVILDSIRSEEVEENRHYIHDRWDEVDAVFANMESDEELERPREMAIHQVAGPSSTPGMDVVYISPKGSRLGLSTLYCIYVAFLLHDLIWI